MEGRTDDAIRRAVRRWLSDPDEVDECVQDVWVWCLEQEAAGVAPTDGLEAWAVRRASSEARHRAQPRRRGPSSEEDLLRAERDEQVEREERGRRKVEDEPGSALPPALLAQLHEALGGLTEAQRRVFLTYWQSFERADGPASYRELAEAEAMTEAAVRGLLNRARVRLRDYFAEGPGC